MLPKGSLVVECGKMLADNGYKVRVFNTVNFGKSMHFNPFHYIHSEKDIMKLVTTLIANTNDSAKTGGDPFWEKSETLLYMALIGYIHYELPPEEQNFASLLRLLNEMNASEDAMGDVPDENGEVHWTSNPVDILFEELRRKKPGCFAVLQYTKFKMAAGKTAKSILISCGVRLAPFDIAEVREITMYDELDLDTLGGTKEDPHTKTALFLVMSDTDKTFNFLLSMIYTQLFNLLCEKADDEFGGRLPIHVRCLIDEFANVGKIPDFDKLIATIRSREISACVILQAQSQLKSMYSDAADTIIGNMDSVLFLGGKESSTLKELSEVLGKQTIDTKTGGESRGKEKSRSTNYQRIGRELMTQDELARMDRGKCILQINGVRPFFSDKYDITKHPRYHLLSDDNPANAFDITRYMDCTYRPLTTDICTVYEYEHKQL